MLCLAFEEDFELTQTNKPGFIVFASNVSDRLAELLYKFSI